MKILAFDTSTKYLSVACLEDAGVKAEYHKDAGVTHSEILIPAIETLLKSIAWDIKDIELICIGLGPGSFTGLRIALATVKGLMAVLHNKVIGVPTMDAIIQQAARQRTSVMDKHILMAPLLDARKEKVYTCIYDVAEKKVKRITDYLLVSAKDFLDNLKEKVIFFGDGTAKYKGALDQAPMADYIEDIDWYPRASDIGRIGYERAQEATTDPDELEPLYLHSKECNIVKREV